MKINIKAELDLGKLNEHIYLFIQQTGEENPYLFMNRETMNAIIDQHFNWDETTKKFMENRREPGRLGSYNCYLVYQNEDLDYGEVEIR